MPVAYISIVDQPMAFLPGIGFRRAGVRLAAPVSVEHDGRTMTVLDLVATPEATDLTYEIAHFHGDANPGPPGGMHKVALSDGKIGRAHV